MKRLLPQLQDESSLPNNLLAKSILIIVLALTEVYTFHFGLKQPSGSTDKAEDCSLHAALGCKFIYFLIGRTVIFAEFLFFIDQRLFDS